MSDTISSRTPEGEPNHCPICDGVISIEPSSPVGDAPCPRCGTLLWFVNTGGGLRFYDADVVERVRQRLIETIGESIGTSDPAEVWDFLGNADSIDTVEIVMQLEEELGSAFSIDEQEHLREIIEWLLRHYGGKAG